MNMHMDEGEILREYKAAKNPKEMITVLADRNCTSNREMAEWLAEHGADVDKRFLQKGIRPKKVETPEAAPVAAIETPEAPKKPKTVQRIRVYVSGAITDNPDFEWQFAAVSEWLAGIGFDPVNPSENKANSYKEYIDIGLGQLMTCDAICTIPGWSKSVGAALELQYAEAVEMPSILIPGKVWTRILAGKEENAEDTAAVR